MLLLAALAWLVLSLECVPGIRTPEFGEHNDQTAKLPGEGVSLVEPIPGSTKLKVNEHGIAALRALSGPLAPVMVIGPYRSGKSFLINQMLDQKCDTGLQVGHRRETQTRGVWMWDRPVPALAVADPLAPPGTKAASGGNASLLFFDTEGFESTGQSDAYDDRIFAFAAVVASTLVYNLAEAVRESDIEKLSFAVELAAAFFPRYSSPGNPGAEEGAPKHHLEPVHMVWVIQRDFLLGKSALEAVNAALAPVPNPSNDRSIEQVNTIRSSLAALSRGSSAVGLPQPHLNRTALCDLPESALDPTYLARRDDLRAHLHATARPKALRGAPLDGPGLADLVEALVAALNDQEFPTAGSMLEAFNQRLVMECSDAHAAALGALPLPVEEARIHAVHETAATEAMAALHQKSFGQVGETLDSKLMAMLQRDLGDTLNRNEVQSSRTCGHLEAECETEIEQLERMALPSLGRFDAKARQCMDDFSRRCVGPARAAHEARLAHAHERERARFQQDYNNRLYNGLVGLALAAAVLCRFIFKAAVPELIGWAVFIFLELYPKLTVGMGSMYESVWWQRLVAVWEALIFNRVLDVEAAWPFLLAASAAALCGYRYWRRRAALARLKHGPREGERDLNV